MAWREFGSLTFVCYPTPPSFLLFCIYMPDSPILLTGQGNKDWQKHVYRPLTQDTWQLPLLLSTCYCKGTTQWLESLHKACTTYAAWNSEVIDQTFKGAFISSFLFFCPVFLVKAPKPLDAYDAVPDAQSSITQTPHAEFCHPEGAPSARECIQGRISSAGSYFSNYKRRGPLCSTAVPWFHMLATLILESKHL